MRYQNFNQNEYYRVTGSGTGAGKIFIDDADRARFIFLITHFQSPIQICNVSWYTSRLFKKGSFMANSDKVNLIAERRNIVLIAFIVLEDRFDLIVKNLEDQILSVYMHRVLTAYSKYFNDKYQKKGHVFAGPFKADRIKNNELTTVSANIHKQPLKYPWSSYQDYLNKNRWGSLLATDQILKHFKNSLTYKAFVEKQNKKTSSVDIPQK